MCVCDWHIQGVCAGACDGHVNMRHVCCLLRFLRRLGPSVRLRRKQPAPSGGSGPLSSSSRIYAALTRTSHTHVQAVRDSTAERFHKSPSASSRHPQSPPQVAIRITTTDQHQHHPPSTTTNIIIITHHQPRPSQAAISSIIASNQHRHRHNHQAPPSPRPLTNTATDITATTKTGFWSCSWQLSTLSLLQTISF